MLSSCSRVAARNAVTSATQCGRHPAMTVGLSRSFVGIQNTASRSAYLPRARRRSCSEAGYMLARRFGSCTRRQKAHANTTELDKEERPIVPPTPLPGLSKSPLQLDRIPEPVQAPSTIRAAIADFLAAQEVGDVKPPPADLTLVKRLWWQAKQLFIFYWNGLKMVYANFKRAQQLRLGVEDHGWKLNRREEVFLRRVDSDVVKLIPFVSVLLILEEVLPLLVLYAPWLLPSTCILPSQLLRIKTDEEKKRREGLMELSATLNLTRDFQLGLTVKGLDRVKLLGLCKATNLGTFAPQSILRRRLVHHLQWLEQDDAMLRQEKNGMDMQLEEKRLALAERGLSILQEPVANLQQHLDVWLDNTSRQGDYSSSAILAMCNEALRIRQEGTQGSKVSEKGSQE